MKKILLIERSITIIVSLPLVIFLAWSLVSPDFKITGGPTYLLIGLLIYRGLFNIYGVIRDFIIIKNNSNWDEILLTTDKIQDIHFKFDKKILIIFSLTLIIFGTLIYTYKNGFFVLLLLMLFEITFKQIMYYLKFNKNL